MMESLFLSGVIFTYTCIIGVILQTTTDSDIPPIIIDDELRRIIHMIR